MLEIRDLHASIGQVEILKGVNLQVKAGELHAIMGRNGSGKSTLANVLAGKPNYVITSGEMLLEGQSLLQMLPEERARAGLFLSFQHPMEIPGVRLDQFIRAGYNAIRKSQGQEELDIVQFNRLIRGKLESLNQDPSLLQRSVNEGFSGGERKQAEILQMAILEPKLAILDEPDSGLDVDALRTVAEGINQLRKPETAGILITHYQRILNHVVPDVVHVFIDGRIAKSSGKELALEVEADGYDKFEEMVESSKLGL